MKKPDCLWIVAMRVRRWDSVNPDDVFSSSYMVKKRKKEDKWRS
jgi:hypothetical protein